MTSNSAEIDTEIWLALADLFFLDTEHDDADYEEVAQLLRRHHWSSEEAERFLVEHLAPTMGANAGYLLWPVIGVWDGFDEAQVAELVRASMEKRSSLPGWWRALRDWHGRWMIRKLGWERLRKRL